MKKKNSSESPCTFNLNETYQVVLDWTSWCWVFLTFSQPSSPGSASGAIRTSREHGKCLPNYLDASPCRVIAIYDHVLYQKYSYHLGVPSSCPPPGFWYCWHLYWLSSFAYAIHVHLLQFRIEGMKIVSSHSLRGSFCLSLLRFTK